MAVTVLDDLVHALRTAQTSVFRAEYRQDYPDDPQWQSYQRGDDWTANDDLWAWCDLVSANTDRGVAMQRVHVVTEPWSPYVAFEVEQHYPWNQRAGEDVRLVRARHPWRVTDFWLVDDQRGWLLDYTRAGVMRPVPVPGEAELEALRDRRDEALAAAEPLTGAFAS